MSFILDLFGKIFRKGDQQEGGDFPVSQMTGKRLNPLYNPKPKGDAFDEADEELDNWMKSMGYRKFLTAERGLPRPKRRFLKKEDKMEVGDQKTMFHVTKFKK